MQYILSNVLMLMQNDETNTDIQKKNTYYLEVLPNFALGQQGKPVTRSLFHRPRNNDR